MRLVTICGSVRRDSINAAVLRVASVAAQARGAEVVEFEQLAAVPPCGGEEEGPAVAALRSAVASADGVVIVTPEYAHSVPGALKNALDWLVLSGELALRPVAVITASTTPTGGLRAMCALVQTLLAQSAQVVALLPVPNAKLMLDEAGIVTHEPVRRRIDELVHTVLEHAPSS